MRRVTFDFDGTIDMKIVQEYAKSLIKRGVDVWICTSRFESGYEYIGGWRNRDNTDIEQIAEELGITKIIYTNMYDKWELLKNNNIVWHLDNDPDEITIMNDMSDIKGILFLKEKWKEKCENFLFN